MTQDTQQLAIREEIRQLAGDVSVPMAEVEMRLGVLYEDAQDKNDEQSMTLINESWNHIQVMHQAYQTLEDLTVAAKETAVVHAEQRDAAQDALKDLEAAMDDCFFTDNEKVRDLVEFVEETVAEEMEYQMGDVFYEQQWDEIRGMMLSTLQKAGSLRVDAVWFVDNVMLDDNQRGLDREGKDVLRLCVALIAQLEGLEPEAVFALKGELNQILTRAKNGGSNHVD